jgi:hypothetical protein
MNNIGPRQWRLDTPIAFGQPNAVIANWNIKVNHFQFSGYAAQGNRAILKDQNGNIIETFTGAADLSEVRSAKIGVVNGLILDTLDAGAVYVYLD